MFFPWSFQNRKKHRYHSGDCREYDSLKNQRENILHNIQIPVIRYWRNFLFKGGNLDEGVDSKNCNKYNHDNLNLLQEMISYKFRDVSLLVTAFTHQSVKIRNVSNYQRLEFLGDSVLEVYLTVCILDKPFKKYKFILEFYFKVK